MQLAIAEKVGGHGGKRPGAGRRVGSRDTPQDARDRLAVAKADREEHEARLAELEVAEKEGTLVSWQIVKRDTERAAMAFGSAMQSIPGRIASKLAVIDDEREIERFLTAVIREELQRIAESKEQ